MKRTLQDLQKQYAREVKMPNARHGMGGPGGRRGGPGAPRMSGKPKNMKTVIARLFSYIAKYKYLLLLVFLLILVTSITSVFVDTCYKYYKRLCNGTYAPDYQPTC